MGTERNAPCPCGSGKKYKRCCALKQHAMSQTTMILLVVAAIGGALALLAMINADAGSGAPTRVWSAEHGHYHEVP